MSSVTQNEAKTNRQAKQFNGVTRGVKIPPYIHVSYTQGSVFLVFIFYSEAVYGSQVGFFCVGVLTEKKPSAIEAESAYHAYNIQHSIRFNKEQAQNRHPNQIINDKALLILMRST